MPKTGPPQPPRHFDVDHRKSDGNACSSIQNYIQAAIAGIVVVRLISAKAQFLKQIVVRDADEPGAVGAGVSAQACVQLGSDPVQHFKVGRGVEVRPLDRRHFESGRVQATPGSSRKAARNTCILSREAPLYLLAYSDFRGSADRSLG